MPAHPDLATLYSALNRINADLLSVRDGVEERIVNTEDDATVGALKNAAHRLSLARESVLFVRESVAAAYGHMELDA